MNRNRMEAFSDGVIAILITIMVFDLKPPTGADSDAAWSVVPALLTYLMSFVFLGIYWNNHHHMLQTASRINGTILWANQHLLFWLSLLPFSTNWVRSSEFACLPVAVYGVVLLLAACAYKILQSAIIRAQERGSPLEMAVGTDLKGWASLILCGLGIAAAFVNTRVALAFYVGIAMLWLIPDRRIESRISPP